MTSVHCVISIFLLKMSTSLETDVLLAHFLHTSQEHSRYRSELQHIAEKTQPSNHPCC